MNCYKIQPAPAGIHKQRTIIHSMYYLLGINKKYKFISYD